MLSVLGVLAVPSFAHATALALCVHPDAVVVSADSSGAWMNGGSTEVDKILEVAPRVLVAEAGLLVLKRKNEILFDLSKWVLRISAGATPTPRAIAEALEAAARRDLPPLARHSAVQKSSAPQITLLIVGFEERFSLTIHLDKFDVYLRRIVSDDTVGFAPHHLDDPRGAFAAQLRRRRPGLPRWPQTLEQTIDYCGLLVAIESELNPSVAPPVRQAILRKSGPVERRIWK
jgi:hypothetical protein